MNENRQMEVHYLDTGFPYSATESFMDFFQGLAHATGNYGHMPPIHDQESVYWSMNINPYKFEVSGMSSAYYSPYEVNDHLPRMDVGRRVWEYPSTEDHATAATEIQSGADADVSVHARPEECSPNHQNTNSGQFVWQDEIDPDNMTYEELLDLGEAVGTQSRGLSKELIGLLPTSKCKFGSFFSRKKLEERCVICQMRYKRGNRQIKLPCNHAYHSECITKWLGISKVCPVCNIEVFGQESSNQISN